MGHGLFAALENLPKWDLWCTAKWRAMESGFLVRDRSCSLLCRRGALYAPVTANYGSGLEFKVKYCCRSLHLNYRSMRYHFQPRFSVAFINAHLVRIRRPHIPLWVESTFGRCFLPKSGRDLMELLYCAPFCHLNRACWGRTRVLDGQWSAKLRIHSIALTRAGGWQRAAVLQGQSESISFLWQAWIRRREESSFAIQIYYFLLFFPILIFLLFSYTDFFLFFFLWQTACWQDFLYMYTLLCTGVSEDGLSRCGEACAGSLYCSLSILNLGPVPCVPWFQERWTSSSCQKVSLCLRSGPVKRSPGTRALDDLLGIQMVNAAQGNWQS